MIPIPKVLEKRLEFGNAKQIEAAKVYGEVCAEEDRAKKFVNNTKAKFFLKEKLIFEILVGSPKIVNDLAVRIYRIDDKKWNHDEARHRTAKRGVFKCQENWKSSCIKLLSAGLKRTK